MLGALGKIGVVGNGVPLPRRVRTILNKYGATMLLPGLSGALRFGYQPGNYRESTGQTLAAADQQVGLVVDAAQAPGPELVTNGDFSNGKDGWVDASTAPGSFTVSFGAASLAGGSTARMRQQISVTPNKVNRISFAAGGVIGSSRWSIGTTPGGTEISSYVQPSAGLVTFHFTPTTSAVWINFYNSDAASAVFSNISVRELPGIHASQSTSGFQPVLRNTAGIQSWQFDGTDDRLSLSAVPFQMADDHFVVAGFLRADAAFRRIFDIGNSGSANDVIALSTHADGTIAAAWRGSDNVLRAVYSSVLPVGDMLAASMYKRGSSKGLRVNQTPSVENLSAVGSATLNSASIGVRAQSSSAYFNGHIHGMIFGKGAITDSELLTLEKFMATLQGRTL